MITTEGQPSAATVQPEAAWTLVARFAPALIGLVIAIGVTAPWMGRGWLLALDWVHGPNNPLGASFPLSASNQPSLVANEVTAFAGDLIGRATVSWLVIAAAIFLSAVAAGRVSPGGLVSKSVAATFYAANPFVFDRILAGQIFVLLAYALLPLVARSVVRSCGLRGWARWSGAAWIAVDAAISVHFLWIGAVLVVALVLLRHDRTAVVWAAGTAAWLVLLNLYLFLPDVFQHATVTVGNNDLSAFRTSADPRFGLYVNVAGLYGFWRVGPTLPKSYVSAWPLLTAAFLAISARGIWRARRLAQCGPLLLTCGLAAVMGYLLAMGDQGPTGPLFRLMYLHLPGFAVMREPQKFSSLLALGYALGLGTGLESLISRASARRCLLTGTVGIATVLAYTPTIFDGLSGQLPLSHYPSDWATAQKVMGQGPGRILVLPLHDYMAFGFTGGQIIANPAPDYFSRRTLIGGQVEAGPLQTDSASPEDAYLEDLVQHGSQLTDLGHLLAQLGVAYVVVFKAADYPTYGWVSHQSDLRIAYQGSDLTVYRNPTSFPEGARLTATLSVPSMDCYFHLAQLVDLTGTAVTVKRGTPCAPPARAPLPVPDVKRLSPVAYRAAAGPKGYVTVPEPGGGTWSSSSSSILLANGVPAFVAGTGRLLVQLNNWWSPLAGDAISLAGLVVIAVGYQIDLRRRSHRGMDTAVLEAANDS